MNAVWTSAIAVAGTLLGALTTGLLQRWVAVRAEHVAERQRLRDAAADLANALTDYRERLYWQTHLETLPDTAQERKEEARRDSWAARSRVNHAMNRLRLATTDDRLLTLATEARNATFAVQTDSVAPAAARERQYALLDAVARTAR
ncbi:hypothetical protein [Streptomyces marincola]|uniref:hypothetical protein n=1 Tax=Streptomyces marincola TaxID=2878388 RepID=UPI001CF5D0C4|nr:hypothetical protein [Streptomyces marincola]UCM89456.1 hypothetical protein LC193_16695 [Streptomyces marincola]